MIGEWARMMASASRCGVCFAYSALTNALLNSACALAIIRSVYLIRFAATTVCACSSAAARNASKSSAGKPGSFSPDVSAFTRSTSAAASRCASALSLAASISASQSTSDSFASVWIMRRIVALDAGRFFMDEVASSHASRIAAHCALTAGLLASSAASIASVARFSISSLTDSSSFATASSVSCFLPINIATFSASVSFAACSLLTSFLASMTCRRIPASWFCVELTPAVSGPTGARGPASACHQLRSSPFASIEASDSRIPASPGSTIWRVPFEGGVTLNSKFSFPA